MIKLFMVQILAGAVAGWAVAFLRRTSPQTGNLRVRWRVLIVAVVAMIAYAYLVGVIASDPSVSDAAGVLGAVLLLVALGLSYALCRRWFSRRKKVKHQ